MPENQQPMVFQKPLQDDGEGEGDGDGDEKDTVGDGAGAGWHCTRTTTVFSITIFTYAIWTTS